MKLCDNSAKSFFLDPDPPWWIYFIFEKDISFEMTIHRMAFNEYTSNTFCMLWQIARMQVPCRLVEYKKYSCPLSSKYSWDSSNLQVGSHSSNVFEQSSSSNREMSFVGSSFWRICPWPLYFPPLSYIPISHYYSSVPTMDISETEALCWGTNPHSLSSFSVVLHSQDVWNILCVSTCAFFLRLGWFCKYFRSLGIQVPGLLLVVYLQVAYTPLL